VRAASATLRHEPSTLRNFNAVLFMPSIIPYTAAFTPRLKAKCRLLRNLYAV
jgi:hypothetical protein